MKLDIFIQSYTNKYYLSMWKTKLYKKFSSQIMCIVQIDVSYNWYRNGFVFTTVGRYTLSFVLLLKLLNQITLLIVNCIWCCQLLKKNPFISEFVFLNEWILTKYNRCWRIQTLVMLYTYSMESLNFSSCSINELKRSFIWLKYFIWLSRRSCSRCVQTEFWKNLVDWSVIPKLFFTLINLFQSLNCSWCFRLV